MKVRWVELSSKNSLPRLGLGDFRVVMCASEYIGESTN